MDWIDCRVLVLVFILLKIGGVVINLCAAPLIVECLLVYWFTFHLMLKNHFLCFSGYY